MVDLEIPEEETRRLALSLSLPFLPPDSDRTVLGEPISVWDVEGNLLYRDYFINNLGAVHRVRTAATAVDSPVLGVSEANPEVGNALIRAERTSIEWARFAAARLGFAPLQERSLVADPSLPLAIRCLSDHDEVLFDVATHSAVLASSLQTSRAATAESAELEERQAAYRTLLSLYQADPPKDAIDGPCRVDLVPLLQLDDATCAAAVGVMVLSYFRISPFPELIADGKLRQAEKIVAKEMKAKGGATPADQVVGYQALAPGLGATVVRPLPSTVRTEIRKGRPVREGLVGHARAISGWCVVADDGHGNSEENRTWIRLVDPRKYAKHAVAFHDWRPWSETKARGNLITFETAPEPGPNCEV